MLSKGLDELAVVQELGRGAMGVVYEARDGRSGQLVALKVLLRQTADEAVELKREFRRLRGVQHPNLVQLGQLGVTEQGIGFTMELVRGTDLVSWCVGRDAEAIRSVFGQLALGLHALHRSDLLHQDIKPSNVLVEQGGRVVLVDFGLSTLTRLATRPSPSGGTYAFMAPEQAWGGPVDEAVDWFAFGGLLFCVLTGEVPPRVGMDPADAARMSLLDDVPATARYLADLCRSLLVVEPAERADFQSVADALNVEPAISAWVQTTAGEFVGRSAELAELEAAIQRARSGDLSVVSIVGPSGIGKSALVRAFLDRSVVEHDCLLLQTQCHPQDAVPFNGMDELMDELAEFLSGLPPVERQALGDEPLTRVARVFTGFRPLLSTQSDNPEVSARTVGLAADAVQRIVQHVSAQRTVVVWLDDVQWADADSLALLQRIFRAGQRNVLVLLNTRYPVLQLQEWLDDVQGTSIRLTGLGDDDVLALLNHQVSQPELIERIVQTADGSPFAVTELARFVTADGRGITSTGDFISEAIRWRVEAHGDEAYNLLAHVALCNGPAPSRMLAALGLADAQLLQRMADQCFLQVDPMTGAVRTYHDTVRRAVLAAVPESGLGIIHRALAQGLDDLGTVDPALVSEHYEAAGDVPRALALARDAAAAARARGAFERAARQYERILRLGAVEDAETAARCADSWASAGRSEPAARWYGRARQWSDAGERAVDLYRLEAEHHLRAGDVERGTAAFRDVFAALGLRFPRSSFEALVRLLYGRARLALSKRSFTLRPGDTIAEQHRTRLDAMYSAGLGLNMVDLLTSAMLATEYSRHALFLGDPDRVARALSIETSYLANAGGDAKRRASQEIAERLQAVLPHVHDPTTHALVALNEGTTLYFSGRWNESLRAIARASESFMPHYEGLNWELGSCQLYRLWALSYSGDFARLAEEAPEFSKQDLLRGDRLFSIALASGHSNMAWLCVDQPVRARRLAQRAIEAFAPTSFQSPEYFDVVAQCHIDLYEGDALSAYERIVPTFKRMQRAQFLRPQYFRVEMLFLRARCAAAAAAQNASRRAGLLAEARSDARRLRREDIAFAAPMADLVDAVVRYNAGEDSTGSDAMDALLYAADRLDEAGVGGFAKMARWTAKEHVDDAVARPDRMMRLTGVVA